MRAVSTETPNAFTSSGLRGERGEMRGVLPLPRASGLHGEAECVYLERSPRRAGARYGERRLTEVGWLGLKEINVFNILCRIFLFSYLDPISQ
ncbi:hypothetical protein NDU88_001378 [Pleurodeles waltl]|uniref:Uncharacterized protein n=1 Tax=Pleurodeles waltl TaxID=8319 RepID=A0AAV7W1B3_PLEWA|nr:hypothetical protein NDU88_001378 [Pleurodeles waltl]